MLSQLGDRIRGVKAWPETLATVASVTRYEQPVGRYGGTQSRACISFWYKDGNQDIQSGEFTVDEDSPLFDQQKDSTFAIRYNPARPKVYWSGDYTPTLDVALYIILLVVVVAVIVFAIIEK
jgi:hypothetical protein